MGTPSNCNSSNPEHSYLLPVPVPFVLRNLMLKECSNYYVNPFKVKGAKNPTLMQEP